MRHALEDRQVHHADRFAGHLGQPGHPARRFALVPVTEARLESLVVRGAVLLGGPGAAQRREGGRVGGASDPDDGFGHERRAYRRGRRAVRPPPPDLDAALAIAKTNPVVREGGGVEVRPVHSSYLRPERP